MPNNDKLAPSRMKLRREIEEPKFTKSNTDSDAPNLAIPNTANEDPTRKKALSDNAEPK
jgi:hypothetical protein